MLFRKLVQALPRNDVHDKGEILAGTFSGGKRSFVKASFPLVVMGDLLSVREKSPDICHA